MPLCRKTPASSPQPWQQHGQGQQDQGQQQLLVLDGEGRAGLAVDDAHRPELVDLFQVREPHGRPRVEADVRRARRVPRRRAESSRRPVCRLPSAVAAPGRPSARASVRPSAFPGSPREPQGGPAKPREAQGGPERPRQAQRGRYKPWRDAFVPEIVPGATPRPLHVPDS